MKKLISATLIVLCFLSTSLVVRAETMRAKIFNSEKIAILNSDGTWRYEKSSVGVQGDKDQAKKNKIQELEAKVRPLPATDIDGNLSLYKQLLVLDPANETYKNKVLHYQEAKSNPESKWDRVTKAVWSTFKRTPHMIDSCALKLAHDIEIDRYRGWPAYCNDFEHTSIVSNRVKELKALINSIRIPNDDLAKLAAGRIWVGASSDYATLSWGTPKKINRTNTIGKVSEQWVYDSGYIYVDDGIISAIQN